MKNTIVFGLVFMLASSFAFAQKGVISGHIKEKSGDDAIGANILIEGTSIGTATDINGNFTFQADPGTYRLIVTYIGFQTLVVDNVQVKANEETKFEFELQLADQQLDEVVVKGVADKSSESFLTVERKNAVQFVQSIGAVELSRKGISNAEAAVTQVTGVSKQEGTKNVFVRGLGDRYNSTSLNGLPLPSEDPQFKNITLDFFRSGVINSVEVNKTFDAEIFGDVAGANIDITSKELFEDSELKVDASFGSNFQTAGKTFYKADGTNFLGTADKSVPISNLNYYTFDNSYQPNTSGSPVNLGLSLSGGKKISLGNNSLRTYFVAALNNDYQYRTILKRQITPDGLIRQDLNGEQFEYNASQFGMLNLAYDFHKENSIKYNALFIHDNGQVVGNYNGFVQNINDDKEDPNAFKSFIRRQQQNDNYVFVNQIISSIALGENLTMDASGSFNIVAGSEPDRRTNSYGFDGENYRVNTSAPSFNHRFYSALSENDIVGDLKLTYAIKGKFRNRVIAGYTFRNTKRDFEATQFNFDFSTPEVVDVNNPDATFNQMAINNGDFNMITARGSNVNALKPFTYSGLRTIHAGYVKAILELVPNLTVNAGVRFEMLNQEVEWDTNLDEARPGVANDNKITRNPFYVLPSLSAKYRLSENDNVRFAASQSYTMPQFKELAPFLYEDVNQASFGNPKLLNAENINVDLGYEHYFDGSQFVAVTGFYKNIKNTINTVQVQSAANEYSYVNTGNAQIAGVELELKKKVFKRFSEAGETSLDLGLSVSYLYSNQELEDVPSDDLVFVPFASNSALEGATPLIINSDLTFKVEGNKGKIFMSALVFTTDMERISVLGNNQSDNIMASSIPRLNFITKYDFNAHLSAGFNLKNILNPDFHETRKTTAGVKETIELYNKGVSGSLSLSYKF